MQLRILFLLSHLSSDTQLQKIHQSIFSIDAFRFCFWYMDPKSMTGHTFQSIENKELGDKSFFDLLCTILGSKDAYTVTAAIKTIIPNLSHSPWGYIFDRKKQVITPSDMPRFPRMERMRNWYSGPQIFPRFQETLKSYSREETNLTSWISHCFAEEYRRSLIRHWFIKKGRIWNQENWNYWYHETRSCPAFSLPSSSMHHDPQSFFVLGQNMCQAVILTKATSCSPQKRVWNESIAIDQTSSLLYTMKQIRGVKETSKPEKNVNTCWELECYSKDFSSKLEGSKHTSRLNWMRRVSTHNP